MRGLAVLLCFCFTTIGHAATLNKCDDGQGHLTFTQQACADGTGGERIKVPPATEGMRIGPPPGSEPSRADASGNIGEVGAAVPPSAPVTGAAAGVQDGYSVVGADPASACGPMTEKEIRAATVRKQVLPGMQARDVQSAWGSPSRKAGGRWIYQIDDCMAWFVNLDGNDCVTGTSKGDSPVGLRCDDLKWRQRQEREHNAGGSAR
ncbi:DUF4124 domain-containing protein [Pseudomonas sp. GD04087]|uniref:DUF4124 domain-containing protein n=1 Tax=Pseudomonas TaxID=286 RepID=UPI001F2ED7CE|nr:MULTISPECIES: DUF4124 domain-containing protein [Pseudomonas]MDH0289770.1 DUF4124 domain-containing protein [Pseudomonas sp. GD04087]MDH1049756.1 DUF4124 domain-containing protein [Pseudomonas sp. GD03903]MDH2002828.1 DUF4124 domain-containing protein [Pseudomonas sp. GD03691]